MNRESIYITIETEYYNFFKFDVILYILHVRDESWIQENKNLLLKLLIIAFYQERGALNNAMNKILYKCIFKGKDKNYKEVLFTK
jgi:hypothetical protein